jgi:hypothetical protein
MRRVLSWKESLSQSSEFMNAQARSGLFVLQVEEETDAKIARIMAVDSVGKDGFIPRKVRSRARSSICLSAAVAHQAATAFHAEVAVIIQVLLKATMCGIWRNTLSLPNSITALNLPQHLLSTLSFTCGLDVLGVRTDCAEQ